MSKLGLLTFAELNTLAGLVVLHLLSSIDFNVLITVGAVVIAAFVIPSLLAIRDERISTEAEHG
ncbi:hypothetical protein [Erythrobacter sp. SD-21]|uniref:hypothetical protein n=1 Tax=Erythrobacter sp. SD-21 TaxID=161528 RepID=UPI000153EF2D|nr:hypothetical protein [Erythrobacter sp. SD-21]EDL50387.1 NADH dehydrogenase subunit D [Erythrobacter sp. SD-21]